MGSGVDGIEAVPRRALLDVEDLSKVYRTRAGEVRALDHVSFSVGCGELVGLLGPNGAGKTTTLKSICGLVLPTEGRITIDGIDAIGRPKDAARQRSAVLEGNRTVYWRLTVRENLEYFASLWGLRARAVRSRIDGLISRFRLDPKSDTPAMKLSRGMQQKLAIACAVLPPTPLLLLDEPTLGLDVETSIELRSYLRQLVDDDGRTILLSSHDMHVVHELCDRVVIINGGRVVADQRVDRLIELFNAKRFRFTLAAPLGQDGRAALAAKFSLLDVLQKPEQASVEVTLRDGSEFYALVDTLRDVGAVVETVESTQPDLEKVFLAIVNEEVPR